VTDRFRYDDEISVGGVEYRLFSVVVHEGTHANNGHYYSFVKKRRGDDYEWLLFNDEKT
jgi:uncharacterized UBP type Zn finger protein